MRVTGPFCGDECGAGPAWPPPSVLDALSAPTADDIAPTIHAVLPPGPAWRSADGAAFDAGSWMGRFWAAVAEPVATLYGDAWRVALESTPSTGTDSLEDWEYELGLPDPCAALDSGEAQRWAAVRARASGRGVITPADYVCWAQRQGWGIRVEEFEPFTCGVSECGGDHDIAPDVSLHGIECGVYECGMEPPRRYWPSTYWRVVVLGVPLVEFECGTSECGDALGEYDLPEVLICRLRRMAPAGTDVFVAVDTWPPAPTIDGLGDGIDHFEAGESEAGEMLGRFLVPMPLPIGATGVVVVEGDPPVLTGTAMPGATITIEIPL